MNGFRIIPRAEWGARYSNGAYSGGRPVILRLPYAETWFHHDVGRQLSVAATFEQDAAAVRATEQVGQDRFGQGISYTWLIAPSGRIFEGHSVDRRGAHTANRNDIARAICWIGNYQVQRLSGVQIRAAAWLLQHNHRAGRCSRRTANGGHRDLSQTACPGDHAYPLIPEINRLAAGPPIDQEDDVSAQDNWAYPLRSHTGYEAPAAAWLMGGNSHAQAARDEAIKANAQLTALIAAHSGQLTEDKVRQILQVEMRAGFDRLVERIDAELAPVLAELLADRIDQQLADEIVAEFVERVRLIAVPDNDT